MAEQNKVKFELQFSINEILPLMARAYAKEAALPIINAAENSSKGMFKKYKIDTEQVDKSYFNALSETIVSKLEETFEAELKNRFKKEDLITLVFSNHTLNLSIGDLVVSTDDFRILFNVLFVDKLSTNLNFNNTMCVDFEDKTFLETLLGDIYHVYTIDLYQIIQIVKGKNGELIPMAIFCFNGEDLQEPNNLVKKFKYLKNIRKQ